jgi:hypothetical protein
VALPDYFTHQQGTAITWAQTGIGGTNALNFNNLLSGSARMGAAVNLGSAWDEEYYVQLLIEMGTAPSAGTRVDLYLACSYNNTTWPAGVTGSEGAWPSDGNEDEWAAQLGWPVTSLIATNDGTLQVQQPVLWRPRGQYVAPVIDNNLDQAIKNEGTATNNDSRLILIPVRAVIQD